MAYGYTLEATYEDGYIHSELELKDESPYQPGKNIFYDIVNKLPEVDHGRMIKFSAVREVAQEDGKYLRFDSEFTGLPDNIKPIYYRNMERVLGIVDGEPFDNARAVGHFFGYEYWDQNNHKFKEEIRLP